MTERVCINSDYQASKAPEEFTKVYHTITHAKVVKIKELENRIEFDIKMNQFLDDSRVRANLIPRDKYHGGIHFLGIMPQKMIPNSYGLLKIRIFLNRLI